MDQQIFQTGLLIDDDQSEQFMYRRVITRFDLVLRLFSFRSAEDALIFLKRSDAGEVDLIFLDLKMPEMNGFEFLERAETELGPRFSQIFVVILTASPDPDDKDRAYRFKSVRDYVQKPLTSEDLNHIVEIAQSRE